MRGCDEPVIAGDITKVPELQWLDHGNRVGQDCERHAGLVEGPTFFCIES